MVGSLILCLIVLGFIRDFVFVNINYAIGFKEGKADGYWGHSNMEFLTQYNAGSLNTSKWLLTVAFILAFLMISLLIIRFLHNDKRFLIWMVLLYTGFFLIGGGLYVFGWLLGHSDTGYTLSREFIGFIQSPLPLMIFLPAIELVKNKERKDPK